MRDPINRLCSHYRFGYDVFREIGLPTVNDAVLLILLSGECVCICVCVCVRMVGGGGEI